MVRDRKDDEAWDAQRDAQRRLSPEDRIRQNDALTRLRLEAQAARDPRSVAEFRASHHVSALDIERILRSLHEADVEYVLIGGVACLVHGASRVTVDADVVPARDLANLARVLDALESLGAAVLISAARSELDAGEPWEVDALRRGPEALLEADAWHFTTQAGPVDVVLTAAGIGTFEHHLARSQTLELFGVLVRVAGLDDLIESKEALGRAKDVSVLDELRRLKQVRD